MRLQATFYRGHDPRWAFSPLSGQGASSTGGRFNPRGVAALYLASTTEGVVVEMTHGFALRLNPLTIVSYDIDVDDIIDLRTDEGRQAANVELADMACAWMLDRASGREPASWRIATRLRKTAAGILVPSFVNRARADMHNLVLWKWGPNLPHRVTAYDPSGRLPKNQLLGPERRYSGNLLPPSPPAEKATAREDQAGQTSIGNRSRDRRVSVSRKSQFLG